MQLFDCKYKHNHLTAQYFFSFFMKSGSLLCVLQIIYITHNVYVYETFGISKHFPVKLQVLLIRAGMLDNALIAKCFIYDVVGR